ncbi:MAG: NifU N-terminal domain-containing protein [Acidimicrobiia bacterium]
MPVTVETTPNPAAMKFTVGTPVGGPATYSDAAESEDPFGSILALTGVRSVFCTADFVTVSGSADIDWSSIVPQVSAILEESYGAA